MIVVIVFVVEVGGLMISWDDVVWEDDFINNVFDFVFIKIGMQLYICDDYLFGIFKNIIYEYFDELFLEFFKKFDNFVFIVFVKVNFDDVLMFLDYVS